MPTLEQKASEATPQNSVAMHDVLLTAAGVFRVFCWPL
jgi:hypothetical protein